MRCSNSSKQQLPQPPEQGGMNNVGGVPVDSNTAAAASAAAYVPAPEDDGGRGRSSEETDGAKLILSSWWGAGCWPSRSSSREFRLPYEVGQSCYKPACLTNLRDEVFQAFVADLQHSLTEYSVVFWPLSTVLYIWSSMSPWCLGYALDEDGFEDEDGHAYLSAMAALLLVVCVYVWKSYKRASRDMELVLQARIAEWQAVFHDCGHGIDCILLHSGTKGQTLPRPFWSTTEIYIHLYETADRDLTTAVNTNSPVVLFPEEANYLVVFASHIPHTHPTFRRVHGRLQWHQECDKPPALHRLDEPLFRGLMRDVDVTLRAHKEHRFRRFFLPGLLVWILGWVGLCYGLRSWLWLPNDAFLGAFAGICVLVILHQWYGMQTLPPKISRTVENWRPRLQAQGFTVDYHADAPSPRWGYWQWTEPFLSIRRNCNDIDPTPV